VVIEIRARDARSTAWLVAALISRRVEAVRVTLTYRLGERSIPTIARFTFPRLLALILALSFVVGFAVFVMTGATTNKGTTGAIAAESARIMSAEKARCLQYGTYASITTLRREGLLTFTPVYNSVVYLPGKHCGTIVIGSPSYQSPSG
jgi:hypothetical protein